ncbi:uncharacterized protein LOC143609234 [Bidens hawaiensis]|uniref:uncharacterized protein LOC143609234 n=1 Tax=Bidens hawaiensis TaxID=980011 RepID=UPI004049B272
MENNAIPAAPIGANTKPVAWSRCNRELTGRSGRSYIHGASQLLMQSYTELRMIYDEPAHVSEGLLNRGVLPNMRRSFSGLGVSALDFDTKGTYLASVTRSGCLSVHNYESLYNNQEEDENEPAWHGFLVDHQGLSAIRWNPIEQAEIAYSSWRNEELILYDLAFAEPTHKLRRTPVNDLILKGYSDIAFVNEGTRVLASDFSGAVNMWDLRVNGLPQMVLTSERNISVTSIDLHGNQVASTNTNCMFICQFVCGASKSGYIHIWDQRGGRSSSNVLQSASEVVYFLILPKTNVLQKEIQSINVNPSCSYQLGFHLADGCSGVFDMHNSRVSHIHCPPCPPWL